MVSTLPADRDPPAADPPEKKDTADEALAVSMPKDLCPHA
jgi:hypothetical protein